MNADMESRPAGQECVCTLGPLGESVYVVTDEEQEYLDAGIVPVGHGPNDKPIFALEEILRHRLGN